MGIANLWKILPLDERVPFPVFISRFIQEYGRPPRFAIDAYMFMFWSLFSNGESDDLVKESYDIRNFMAKLWYMVLNNVSFVVVFDGSQKPDKLRHGHIPGFAGSDSYDEILEFFLSSLSFDYSESLRIIEELKRILARNRMDWVQAPAEAEAECAWLQKLGVVDYVISDDSDTLVFGATKVLRWFNRIKYYTKEKKPVQSSTDYYVTPVHMSRIEKETNFTRNHLVMMAVLRGGDYSKGAEDIGITRAKEIALCGTTMLVKQPRKATQDYGSLRDITRKFVYTFLDSDSLVPSDPYFGRKAEYDRHESLLAFNKFLNEVLQIDGLRIFGRITKLGKEVRIDDYYAMLYFFPLVNSKIFKFTPHSTSFAEPYHVSGDLISPKLDFEVSRYNYVISPKVIGRLIKKNGVHNFHEYVNLKVSKTPLPRERKDNLKPFVLKFLKDRLFWKFIQFAKTREFEGVSMAVLKFDRLKLNEYVYYTRKDLELDSNFREDKLMETSDPPEEPEDEHEMVKVVVPLECVSYISPEFVKSFKPQPQRKSPLKKKFSPQKTKLDSIWPRLLPMRTQGVCSDLPPTSPTPQNTSSTGTRLAANTFTLNANLEHILQVNALVGGSSQYRKTNEKHVSPKEKNPMKKLYRRKKENKAELSPGQPTLTLFLLLRRGGASEINPVLVDSEEDEVGSDEFYRKMKDAVGFGPVLSGPNAAGQERQLSSPELSPTKRHRKEMDFSPENSPVKARPETKTPW